MSKNIDHFWITIRAGSLGSLVVALSTYSRKNAEAGFDPRMRVGSLASSWNPLPADGVFGCQGLDYQRIEAETPVTYAQYERSDLEQLLSEKTGRAIFIEAWGELYVRKQLGIHQVHSRRASCSVAADYIGRDGAIRFYFPQEKSAEMLLFKYCGQV